MKLKNIIIYSISSALNRISLLILSIIGFFFLTPKEMAVLSVLISYSSLFIYFFDFGLSKALVRFFFILNFKRQEYFREIFRIRIKFTTILILTFISLITFILFYFKIEKIEIINLISLITFGVAESIWLLFLVFCRIKDTALTHLKLRLLSLLLTIIISIVINLLFIKSYLFLIFSIINLICSIFCLIKFNNLFIRNIFSKSKLPIVKIFKYSFPLVLHDISWWLRSFGFVVLVSKEFEPQIVNSFFIAMIINVPMYLLINGIDQTFSTYYYKFKSLNNKYELKNLLNIYRLIGWILLIPILLSCLTYYFTKKYFNEIIDNVLIESFLILLVGPIIYFCYTIWIKSLMFSGKTKYITMITLPVSFLTYIVGYFHIGNYGYKFAAILSVVSFLIISLLIAITVYILKQEIIDFKFPLFLIFISSLFIFISLS